MGAIVKVRVGQHVEGRGHLAFPQGRGSTQRLVHGLLDRGSAQLSTGGAERALIEIDQMLGHTASIYAVDVV